MEAAEEGGWGPDSSSQHLEGEWWSGPPTTLPRFPSITGGLRNPIRIVCTDRVSQINPGRGGTWIGGWGVWCRGSPGKPWLSVIIGTVQGGGPRQFPP